MNQPVKVRPAEERDLNAVMDLWTSMMVQHEAIDRRIWQRAPQGAEAARAWFAGALTDAQRQLLVAESDGRVVGFAHGMVGGNPPPLVQQVIGLLTDLFVDERCRRRGVGRGLADRMFTWFRERNAVGAKISVAEGNPGGQAFWAAIGTCTYLRSQWIAL